jgi:hypothetical protein
MHESINGKKETRNFSEQISKSAEISIFVKIYYVDA